MTKHPLHTETEQLDLGRQADYGILFASATSEQRSRSALRRRAKKASVVHRKVIVHGHVAQQPTVHEREARHPCLQVAKFNGVRFKS